MKMQLDIKTKATIKRGTKLVARFTSEEWKLTQGEQLKALKAEYFQGGEFWVATDKGDYPSIFFEIN